MLTFPILFPSVPCLAFANRPDLNTSASSLGALFNTWLITLQAFKPRQGSRDNDPGVILTFSFSYCNSVLIKAGGCVKNNFCKQLHLDSFKCQIILEIVISRTTTSRQNMQLYFVDHYEKILGPIMSFHPIYHGVH